MREGEADALMKGSLHTDELVAEVVKKIPESAPRAASAAALLFCLGSAGFALDFPALTGRVVDQAGVMSAESRADVEAESKELEDKSVIQLVVATVKSL